ncbi:MAG: hypothetical protein MRJ93_14225 [Nitrososphaeraceae archaeon]|nr:hypothetical protein [Nitrososphaeraceae archaeon]
MFPLVYSNAIEIMDDRTPNSIDDKVSNSNLKENSINGKLSENNQNLLTGFEQSNNSLTNFLDTKILEVRDGKGVLIKDGDRINTDSITLQIAAKNVFDVDGVRCNLNQQSYSGCELFNDPSQGNEKFDSKDCTTKKIVSNEDQSQTFEICTFNIEISNFTPGPYEFQVASFHEEEPSKTSVLGLTDENYDKSDKILGNKDHESKTKTYGTVKKPSDNSAYPHEYGKHIDDNDLSMRPFLLALNGPNNIPSSAINQMDEQSREKGLNTLSNDNIQLDKQLTEQNKRVNTTLLDTTPATFKWSFGANTTINHVVDGNGNTLNNDSITNSDSINFTFSTIAAGKQISTDKFICSLDNQKPTECGSGLVTYNNLEFGNHDFTVQSIIKSKNVENSGNSNKVLSIPAKFSWNIIPQTIITSAVLDNQDAIENKTTINSKKITFSFSTSNPNKKSSDYTFECSLDNEIFKRCLEGSKTYSNLDFGTHLFKVKSLMKSKQGSFIEDSNPAVFIWKVNPNSVLSNATDGNNMRINDNGITESRDVTFNYFGEIEGNPINLDKFQCYLDGIEFFECDNGKITLKDLDPGYHEFKVATVIDNDKSSDFSRNNSNSFTQDTNTKKFEESKYQINSIIPQQINKNNTSSSNHNKTSTFSINNENITTFSWNIAADTIIDSAVDGSGLELDKANNTSSNSAKFAFSALSDGKPVLVDGFKCTLDDREPVDCSANSIAFANLSPGKHSLKVTSVFNGNGVAISDPTPAVFSWDVDPNTVIESAVDGSGLELDKANNTSSNSAKFAFSALSDGKPVLVDGFKCTLDDREPVDCSANSIAFDNLSPGKHSLKVESLFNNTGVAISDPTPARFTWSIAPDTVIDSAIDGNGDLLDEAAITSSNSAKFTFSALSNNQTINADGFICKIDEMKPSKCNDEVMTLDSLPEGDHRFGVFSYVMIDNKNAIKDPSPDWFTWSIDNDDNKNTNTQIDDIIPDSGGAQVANEVDTNVDEHKESKFT